MMDEKQVIEAGELTLTIEWVYDDATFVDDWLGTYMDKPESFVVDRQEGILYGENSDEPEPEDFGIPDEDSWYPDKDDPYFREWEAYEKAWSQWNDRYGMVELARELHTNYERGEWRYFKPEAGHLPHAAWDHVGTEIAAKVWVDNQRQLKKWHIDTGDKTYDLDVLYTCQDYERVVGLERGDWCFMGCIATVTLKNTEIGHASLWGIEGDSDKAYFQEVEKEQIAWAIEDAATTLSDLDAFDAEAGLEALRGAVKEKLND